MYTVHCEVCLLNILETVHLQLLWIYQCELMHRRSWPHFVRGCQIYYITVKIGEHYSARLTFVKPVRDAIEDLPRHAVPRHADHLGPRVLSRARVTCHVSSWVSPHLLEVDVVAVHHDQAPAPGPGRVLQPRVLARGHAQPHQRVRGARGGGFHLIVLANFRGNMYLRYL